MISKLNNPDSYTKAQVTLARENKEKIEALEKENEALVKERNEQIEALESMLEQPLSLELYTIKTADLPDNISTSQISGLTKIIE